MAFTPYASAMEESPGVSRSGFVFADTTGIPRRGHFLPMTSRAVVVIFTCQTERYTPRNVDCNALGVEKGEAAQVMLFLSFRAT
jgi:hypothetical protein